MFRDALTYHRTAMKKQQAALLSKRSAGTRNDADNDVSNETTKLLEDLLKGNELAFQYYNQGDFKARNELERCVGRFQRKTDDDNFSSML